MMCTLKGELRVNKDMASKRTKYCRNILIILKILLKNIYFAFVMQGQAEENLLKTMWCLYGVCCPAFATNLIANGVI